VAVHNGRFAFLQLLHSALCPLADNRATIMTIIAPRVIMEDVATVGLPTPPAVQPAPWIEIHWADGGGT